MCPEYLTLGPSSRDFRATRIDILCKILDSDNNKSPDQN